MKLSQLQDAFQAYLTKGEKTAISPIITDKKGFGAQRGLKVYYDAYRLRLCEILKLDFPKTYAMMGDENFEPAFASYLDQYPSHHFSVRYFGQHFSEFLRNTAPYKEYPVLAEMAEFEWAVAFTIDSSDGPIATAEDFNAISPEHWPDLCFTIHPSVTHRFFNYDTPQMWQLIENEEPLREPIKQQDPVLWLFWRKEQRSFFRSCNIAQQTLFLGMIQQQPFGELCENLLSILPEDEIAAFAAGTLYQWVQDEMISSISIAN